MHVVIVLNYSNKDKLIKIMTANRIEWIIYTSLTLSYFEHL